MLYCCIQTGAVNTIYHCDMYLPFSVQTAQEKSQSLFVPQGKVKLFRCAFFVFPDRELNQSGGWSYSGVETVVINTTHVRCMASHLTSFVVLVSIAPPVGEPVSCDGSVHLNKS